MQQKYKLTIAYDGTHYGGWQIQPNAPSIQAELQRVFEQIYQQSIHVTASGRTDAGVHALAQVAHVTLPASIDIDKLQYSLNCLLPTDIRVCSIEDVFPEFHARFSAKKKIYRYHFSLAPYADPFRKNYCYFVRYPLCIDRISSALPWFCGTKNFRSFANKCTQGSASTSPIKTIDSILLHRATAEDFSLEFTGNGFLYKMVRNITGTLFEVGEHKLGQREIECIFAKKNRAYAGKAAPPQGLFLVQVQYT